MYPFFLHILHVCGGCFSYTLLLILNMFIGLPVRRGEEEANTISDRGVVDEREKSTTIQGEKFFLYRQRSISFPWSVRMCV